MTYPVDQLNRFFRGHSCSAYKPNLQDYSSAVNNLGQHEYLIVIHSLEELADSLVDGGLVATISFVSHKIEATTIDVNFCFKDPYLSLDGFIDYLFSIPGFNGVHVATQTT